MEIDDEQVANLLWFGALPSADAHEWLAREQAARQAEALAECQANGAHVLQSAATACPNCGTSYADLD